MFKCEDCGLVFNTPEVYTEDRTPGLGFEGGSFIDSYSGCPRCGGSYTEAMPCPRCGIYLSIKEGPFCEECTNKILKSFEKLVATEFREDEWETILDNLDSVEPYKNNK